MTGFMRLGPWNLTFISNKYVQVISSNYVLDIFNNSGINTGKSKGFSVKICPREVPRVSRLS